MQKITIDFLFSACYNDRTINKWTGGEDLLKATGSKKIITEKHPYYEAVADIINSEEVQSLKEFGHHIYLTRFQHSFNVSYYNYVVCKFFGLDAKSAARAGLLHDLFFYDRHTCNDGKGKKNHLREHPALALENAEKSFDLNDIEKDIIKKHMFPLTLKLPKYRETAVIILTDKFCALMEMGGPKLKKIFGRIKETALNIFTLLS